MSSHKLSQVTHELIASSGNTARHVIQGVRAGNARMAHYVDQRWATALNKAGSQLSAEARSNALAAEQKVCAYYTRGVNLGAQGADLAVRRVQALAGNSLNRVSANAQRFEKASGLKALHTLAAAAVPTALAVQGLAARMEARSGAWAVALAKPQAKAKSLRVCATACCAQEEPLCGQGRLSGSRNKVLAPASNSQGGRSGDQPLR